MRVYSIDEVGNLLVLSERGVRLLIVDGKLAPGVDDTGRSGITAASVEKELNYRRNARWYRRVGRAVARVLKWMP